MRRITAGRTAVLALAITGSIAIQATAEDMRIDALPGVHALTDVRIFTSPGSVIESGTVVIRDGVIERVGPDVIPPPDARLWEYADADPAVTVYAGFIDPYVERPWPEEAIEAEKKLEGDHDNVLVRPERRMVQYAGDDATAEKLRQAGYTVANIAPEQGLFRGQSAVVALSSGDLPVVVSPSFAQNVTFRSNSWEEGFPTSLMGAVTLFRQTLMETSWHREAARIYDSSPAQARPHYVTAYTALDPVVHGEQTIVFETDDPLDTLRVAKVVEEFDLDAYVVGNGSEYRWVEAIGATGLPHLLPLDFPEPPTIRTEGEDEFDPNVELDELRHWDSAPTNPAALVDAGVPVAFTTHRLSDSKQIHKHIRTAIEEGGLSPDEAVAALTTTPAELLGLERRLGTVERGKSANLTLVEGELFGEDASVREVWIDGRRFEVEITEPPTVEPAGTWELTAITGDGQEIPVTLEFTGEATDLSGRVTAMGQSIDLASATVSGSTIEVSFDGTAIGVPGTITMSLTMEGERVSGSGVAPMGPFSVTGRRTSTPETLEVWS